KIKGAGSALTLPALCHFNKEQTPLGDLFDPNPRFHGGCFGVWGTPSAKPLNCKIRSALPGCAIGPRRHTTSATIQSSPSPISGSRQKASCRCPFIPTHSFAPFVR